jgi:hypothetical protein
VTVVGLGARDTLEDARDFVADRGTTFPMLWDESAASWRAFEVPTQPAAVLVAADGTWLGRWSGEFDEAEVLRLLERAAVASTAVPA